MRLTIATAVACLLAGVSIADDARASIRKSTNIPAQNLGEALQALARNHNVQVVYFSTDIDASRTHGAVGELTAAEAFEKVLSGTGFTFRYLGENTITIVPIVTSDSPSTDTEPTAASKTSPQANRSMNFRNRMRLAQATGSPTAAGPRDNDVAASGQGSLPHSIELEEITVTGTHIRGAENLTAPVVVLDREFIDATGMTTAVQLIESLPQNFALANQSTTGGILSGTSFASLQGSTINLRGIGEGTTLTLVNGRRMPLSYQGSAVNISALPLSAIERVEVLTDGASALYGSDAVGGVVNFILRQDFDGAETRARIGSADSVDEHRLSQTFGHHWSSGNLVVSAEHFKRDMLSASDRDFGTNGRTTVGSLLPQDENLAFTFFGRQDLTADIDLFADVLYTDRDSENHAAHLTPTTARVTFVDNSQLSATAGLGWRVGSSWRVELSGGYGEDDLTQRYLDPLSVTTRSGTIPVLAKFTGTDLKADGALMDLPGGTLRLAVGAHWREEALSAREIYRNAAGVATSAFPFEKQRDVSSLFAEALVPLVGAGNAMTGIQRLELSLAGRFDDYSDFGSSVDPRIGIAWMPWDTLRLRGSWGTSYLAPKLKDFEIVFNSAAAVTNHVLANGLTTLAIGGNAPESLKPQESENYTLGLEWTPESLPGAAFSVNYFSIDYRDKIERVNTSILTMLANPRQYGDMLILDPTLAQVQQYIGYGTVSGRPFQGYNADFTPNPNFDLASIELIVDGRRRNLGVVRATGFDLSASYDFKALGGQMRIALDGSYFDELTKQVTATSEPIDTLDSFGNPTHLRLRVQVAFRRGGWAFNTFVHRKNSYTDDRFLPYVGMDSYTTVDANVGYRFGNDAGLLSNLSIAFGAINVLDEDPPQARVRPTTGLFDLGFDPTNASPLGRLLTLDITKPW